jgi:asparagine synthase (glutamine-hydrolysing)
MENEDGTLKIVFNGEIYNHADLRRSLERHGHQYRTHSDTETILHNFEETGIGGISQLRGMFAFAVWNRPERLLVLARDHSGIKPMYYTVLPGGGLVFGSEVKAIVASGLVDVRCDEAVVAEHFATGHVSGARTLLDGVHKLPPAHVLLWQNGQVRVQRYWDGSTDRRDPALPETGGNDGWGDEFWRRFSDSVRSQLMADVPLGVFLSGGIDSSLIVAAMTEVGVEKVQSFSVGYTDAPESELPWARVAAGHLGTEHHEVIVGERQFFDHLAALTWVRDFPLVFSASIPLYVVAQVARRSVKVVLTGEGSDELFAGYGRYPRALFNLRWAGRLDRWLPGGMRELMVGLSDLLPDGWAGDRVRRSFVARQGTLEEVFLDAFSDVPDALRGRLLSSRVPRGNDYGEGGRVLGNPVGQGEALEAMLHYDQVTYLEELLMKQDSMSMAASLESRVPFLDHELVAWSGGLPPAALLDGWQGKALVRGAARRRLPPKLVEGPKRGFSVPLGRWLRAAIGRELLEDMACSGGGIIERRTARHLVDEHTAGRDRTAVLWRAASFHVWHTDVLPRLGRLAQEARRDWSGSEEVSC